MTKKLWGGRFKKKTDPLVEEFTTSIDYDYKLAKYDVLGSIFHVLILKKANLLTGKEAERLGKSLKRIYTKIDKKKFLVDRFAEDIHTNIQNAIEKEVGNLALKLHTARSRNDQVLFDLKLFCNAELGNVQGFCLEFEKTLKAVSNKAKGVIIPGYTHMQHAQLVYLSDYLGSYIEMMKRDYKRLKQVKIGIKFSWAKIKEMAKFGLPLIPTQFGAFIVHLSDRFFIKGYCSIADAGLYSLGYKFGAIPSNFISAPFNQVWQPRRFEIYKEPNAEETFGRIFTYFVGLIFFAGLGVSVLTKDVLILMADEKYWSAYKIVPIIVLATTIFTFHYHLNMGILIAKKTKYLAYINFSNGGLILILNFLLIPRYGVYGAAYATLIAFIYKIALTYYFSSKYYKISFESLRIAKILMSAVLIYLVCQMIHADSIYQTILIKTGSVLCFPVLLVCTGFLHENEKTKIKDIFRSIVSR